MKKYLFITLLAIIMPLGGVFASEVSGNLSSGLSNGSTINGVAVVAPTASIATGTFHASQSVTLTAAESHSIRYTLTGTDPTCSSGTVYSSAITINTTTTLKAVSCYDVNDSIASTVSTYTYTFTCTTSSVSNGTVSAYPTCGISCNSGYTLSGSTCISSGGGGGGGGGGGSFTTPLTVPTGGFSIKINNDDVRTLTRDVTLTLNGGTDAKTMTIANGESFVGIGQEVYTTTKSWTLTEGEAVKKVCVRFYNQNGYYSNVVCDEIILGNTITSTPTTSSPTTTTSTTTTSTTSKNIPAIDALLYFKYGDVNPKIRQLQLELKKAGFLAQSVPLSNRYGEATRDAVQKYKDSLSGATTLSSMNREDLLRFLIQLLYARFGITI